MNKVLLLILCLTIGNSYCCICTDFTLNGLFDRADFVFVGEIIDVKQIELNRKCKKTVLYAFEITFNVTESFKAKVGKEIKCLNYVNSTCDYIIDFHGKFIVFANSTISSKNDESCLKSKKHIKIATGVCGGTEKINKRNEHIIKRLQQYKDPLYREQDYELEKNFNRRTDMTLDSTFQEH